MRYFFDFDRTVFDTPSFKRDFAGHPSFKELIHQAKAVFVEALDPKRTLTFRKLVMRVLGTYASHRRFGFKPHELKEYLYPDAVDFFAKHGKDCVIVTYGVRAFITAKVTNALAEFPLADIVYTHRKKGRTIERLTKGHEGPFVFVDDMHFQLESVARTCPDLAVIEMRRDNLKGDGRWPVIHSFDELYQYLPKPEISIPDAKVAVILNVASGSTEITAEEEIRTILKHAGVRHINVWSSDSSTIQKALLKVTEHAPDILIVLGGDGTIRSAAEACTGEGPLLIPLPGGTMNMLPKALYGTRSWQEALRDTLETPHIETVSGGLVSGRQFFIAAIAGAPTLWTHAREALRMGDLGAAVERGAHALQHMFDHKVRYRFSDTSEGEAEAVAVICPLISDALDNTHGAFEAAAVSIKNAGEVVTLASAAAFGKWREDSHVSVVSTNKVEIRSEKDVPLILDGEPVEAGQHIEITFVPAAFKALVPAKMPEKKNPARGLKT